MKTLKDQKTDLENTIATKRARLEEIMTTVAGEGRSTDDDEGREYDAIEGEVTKMVADVGRLERAMASQTLTPVGDGQSAKSVQASRLPVQVKNTEKDDGLGIARVARVMALAKTGQAGTNDMIQIAKAIYPDRENVLKSFMAMNRVNKAVVHAANTMDTDWAQALITDGGAPFADFVEYLRPRTLFGQISGALRNLPFDTPVLIQASTGTAKWVKEGTAKPLTEWTYTRTKLAPLKVAAIAAATKEMLMRASVAADRLLRDELARAVGATIDQTFIDPAAAPVADESPGSILNGVPPTPLSGGTDFDAVRCDVATLMNVFIANNQTLQGAFWIMTEALAVNMSQMTNPLGQAAFPGLSYSGGTLAGIPVYASNYVGGDSGGSIIALVKGDEIFLGDEGGLQVAMSDQASLVMDSTPVMSSVTPAAAQVVSMWQTNSVAFLVERFVNWQRRRPVSVAWGQVNYDACA
jgi:HK97 family phage major capsid protein